MKAMGKNAGFSGVEANLPFDASSLTDMQSKAGTYTVTFAYNADGSIDTVTCKQ